MPLSEHEQRQLELIEQALYADDPKLARAVRAQDPRVHYKRRIVMAVAGFAAGVCLLLAGLVLNSPKTPLPAVTASGAGFAAMVASALWALASWRHMGGFARRRSLRLVRSGGNSREAGSGRRRRRRGRGNRPGTPFMERMEERWHRRQQRGR